MARKHVYTLLSAALLSLGMLLWPSAALAQLEATPSFNPDNTAPTLVTSIALTLDLQKIETQGDVVVVAHLPPASYYVTGSAKANGATLADATIRQALLSKARLRAARQRLARSSSRCRATRRRSPLTSPTRAF